MNPNPTYTSFTTNPDAPGVPDLPPLPVAGDVRDSGNLTDPGGGSTVVQPVQQTMPITAQP